MLIKCIDISDVSCFADILNKINNIFVSRMFLYLLLLVDWLMVESLNTYQTVNK